MGLIHPWHPGLADFASAVESICRADGDAAISEPVVVESVIVESVRSELERLLAGGLTLDPHFTAPQAEHYVMYPLFIADDGAFSIAAAVWGPGQTTPIHDHGVWGVVGIVSGVEHERRFEADPSDGPSDGLVDTRTTDFHPGETVVCCTAEDDIHQVSCGGAEPCVGIHVYGTDIGRHRRHSYDPVTGATKEFVSAWPSL